MGLPTFQSLITSVLNRYCLMISGLTNACHTFDGGALIVLVAFAVNFLFMLYLRFVNLLFDSTGNMPQAVDLFTRKMLHHLLNIAVQRFFRFQRIEIAQDFFLPGR